MELVTWSLSHGACHMELVTWSLSHGACHMELVTWSLSHGASPEVALDNDHVKSY